MLEKLIEGVIVDVQEDLTIHHREMYKVMLASTSIGFNVFSMRISEYNYLAVPYELCCKALYEN